MFFPVSYEKYANPIPARELGTICILNLLAVPPALPGGSPPS
jgi:hypothetical protein